MNRSLSLRAPSHLVDDIDAAVRANGLKDRTELCLRALQEYLLRLQLAPAADASIQAIATVDQRITDLQSEVQTITQWIIRLAEATKAKADEARMQRVAIETILAEMGKLNTALSSVASDGQ